MTTPRTAHRRFLRALAIVCALFAMAAAPPVLIPVQPAPGPLFNPDEIHTNPINMTLAVVGASTQPATGRYAALAALYTGEQTKAWNLEGVMTNRYSRISTGVGTLVLSGFDRNASAFAELAALTAGQYFDCWALINTDRFEKLPQEWLNAVVDGRGVPVGGVEAEVYSRVLTRANFTSSAAFKNAARKDVTYTHVFEDPERYRGVVVHIEGRLLRVNRHDPTFEAAEAGVNDIYEAWIFNEFVGTNPYCVQFTEWPADLPRDVLGVPKIGQTIKVSVDGYFFKKYRYRSNDRRSNDRDAPMVIGHGLVVLSQQEAGRPASLAWLNMFSWVFGGVVLVLILGVVGITYWYRRSDIRVRRRIMARMPEFALPPPDSPPVASPAAPVARPVRGHEAPIKVPYRITFPTGTGHRGSESHSGENGGPKKESPPNEDAGG
jgi:hypothetical protein